MPLKEGWEGSPDSHEKIENILNTDKGGDPILFSKCSHYPQNAMGFLIVSNKGIVWSEKITVLGILDLRSGTSSRWVRWHDVVTINPIKPGVIKVEVNKRKKGRLLIDKRGIPKTKVWTLRIYRNKNEIKSHFEQRKAKFFGIMKELYSQYKTDANPPISDSRT